MKYVATIKQRNTNLPSYYLYVDGVNIDDAMDNLTDIVDTSQEEILSLEPLKKEDE